ncbi:odorant receptor 30a-like [Maniola hyperantus]|uniref:odorant receptor 30a-like n=1 Tax=Aphantopus hyperantus TaxID=2795564 RepID=UPI00156938BA|nr:odorant receptor 67a-like [Maniola hyperantus]
MQLIQELWSTLRSFGLDHNDFTTMIENVALLLRTMTIDIYKDGVKRVTWLYYIVTIVAGACYFYVFILSSFWLVFFRYRKSKNYTGMAVAMSLTCCNVTCITKLAFMILNVKPIREIVDKYLKCDAQIEPETRFATNLRKNLRVVKKRALVIWNFLVWNCVVYVLIPILRPGRHVTEDIYILFALDPMLESPHYEIYHILNTISVGFCAYIMVNVAVFVIVVVGYNEAHLYTMSVELRNLWKDSQNFYNKVKQDMRNKVFAINMKDKIINEYIRVRLTCMVQYHVTNIHLFRGLNGEFQNILALEYGLLSIAIIGELLGGLDNTYLQVPYTTVKLYMDCLSGQRLIDACLDFEKALYDCEWENFSASNQKTIYFMLLMSQKTLMLSAGGLANLNYMCLMAILKSAYSAYTALKSSLQH